MKNNLNQQMTKRQHYVPQFYLRNFTNRDGMLSVYNKSTKSYYESNPNGICFEKNLYETQSESNYQDSEKYILQNQIEHNFAEKEGEYSVLLKKIIDICKDDRNRDAQVCCNIAERRLLSSFVSNMIVRNPWSMDQSENDLALNELTEKKDIKTIDCLLQSMKFGNIISLIYAADKRVLLNEDFP